MADRQYSPEEWLPYIEAPRGDRAIELSGLEIAVKVSGLLAETTQTMRFYNANDRALEGSLSFPLPDNAVVCGYALDVEGQMVDGVVVAKQEARLILEAEERKVILAREYEDRSFVEIGTELGMTANAARMRWVRAVARLAEVMQQLKNGTLPDDGTSGTA